MFESWNKNRYKWKEKSEKTICCQKIGIKLNEGSYGVGEVDNEALRFNVKYEITERDIVPSILGIRDWGSNKTTIVNLH